MTRNHVKSEYLWKALRHGKHGGIDVVGFKEMPASSVLAGQIVTCFIDSYETAELAMKDYPDVEGFTNEFLQPPVSVAHLPGEDDPVPGGMYPDDWE